MITQLLVVVGVSLAVSFLCSVLEAVLLSVGHSYVAVLQGRGDRAGRILAGMKERIEEPIAAILTLNTIAHTIGATVGGAMAERVFGGGLAVAIFAGALTFAVLVFSEIIPKTLGATFCNALARPAAFILQVMVIAMKPALIPLGYLSRWSRGRNEARETISRAEIEALAELGRREGTLDEDEFKVMSNVMQLDDIAVSEIMTPRIDIVAVPAGAGIDEAMDLMLDRGKLRLPVYEGDLDRMVGIVVARDLWRAAREGVATIAEITRSAHFAPATTPVEDLIRRMRQERNRMTIVLDEFGGTAGLVTLEDLIEEIVGTFQEEHETNPREFREVGGGGVVIRGGTPVRDVEQRLGVEIGDDFDTIAGYVLGELGRIGRRGDSVRTRAGEFRVLEVNRRRRIQSLLFVPKSQQGTRKSQ